MYRYRSTGTAACTVPVHRYMRTQTPTKRVYLLDPNGVKNLALDGTVACIQYRLRVRHMIRVRC